MRLTTNCSYRAYNARIRHRAFDLQLGNTAVLQQSKAFAFVDDAFAVIVVAVVFADAAVIVAAVPAVIDAVDGEIVDNAAIRNKE